MITILLLGMDGNTHRFHAEDLVDGVPINPRLPDGFDDTANERRSSASMAWWNVPFIRTYNGSEEKFLATFPSGIRYDVRCLDGGAWDRSTWWGSHPSLDLAVAQAASNPPENPVVQGVSDECYTYECDVVPFGNGEPDRTCSVVTVPAGEAPALEGLSAFTKAYCDTLHQYLSENARFPAGITIRLVNHWPSDDSQDPEPITRGTLEEIRKDLGWD